MLTISIITRSLRIVNRIMAKTKLGTICVANLCRSAVDEMIYLDGEFETFRFAHKGTPIPTWDKMRKYLPKQ